MRSIVLGVAALALVAGSAQAQGNGRGNGERGGGRPEAAAQGVKEKGRGQGNDRAERGRQDQGPSMASSMRGSEQRGPDMRGNGNERRAARVVERANDDRGRDDRGRGKDNRREGAGPVVVVDRDGRNPVRLRDFVSVAPRRLIDGCPPGLAKKRNGCQPPGQARRDDWRFGYAGQPGWWGMPWLRDGNYFYRDGYLLRLDGGRFGGYIPLLGGALAIGNPWPTYYEPVLLPDYYSSFYGLGPSAGYRYADNVIYRVDPETAAITSIAALLTGDDFAVGRPMPLGYDVYNVPWGYRDRYYDRPDALYRYSDGYIYQVDPETRLIAAAIELLAS